MLELRPIKNETDYRAALEEIEKLFDVEPDTPEFERLNVLITLVEEYEELHYPVEAPEPIEAILYHLESRGLTQDNLQDLIVGQQAQIALSNSQMVGTETFTAELKRLAALDGTTL